MKKSKKTAKKPAAKKVIGVSSEQTEGKASLKSSQQTENKAPIKSSRQSAGKSSTISPKQIKEATPIKTSPKTDTKGIKKQYLKSKPVCKVTFRLPGEAAPGAKTVSVVGDFNNWDAQKSLMKKMSNGDFSLMMELPCNKEYSFRYLIDAQKWENDWCADKYIPNDYGEDNSVVIV